MDLENVKSSIVNNVYHIPAGKEVALHKHPKHNEILYCIKGEGFGILEDGKVELTVGKAFIVDAGVMHALGSDSNLHVASFLIPVVE